MNSFYHIKQKGKIALLLLVLVIVELLSDNSQSKSISQLGDAFNEVYSDRLIAQDYIYKITENVHEQKYRLLKQTDSAFNNKILAISNTEIINILKQYEVTKLTSKEEKTLLKLKGKIHIMQKFATGMRFSDNTVHLYTGYIDAVSDNLKTLSEIQVERSREINGDSIKIISFSTIIDQLNLAMLIVMGLLIQVIVFTSKSLYPKAYQNKYLN